MFEKFVNKINTIKEENNHYKELLETTTTFQNLYPIPTPNTQSPIHKITYIINECPDINKDKANLIATLIPINETFLSINYAKEIKTDKEYYLVATNKYLWVITQTTYGAYPYNNFNCQIIKNNLMSKTILINNILLEITGNNNKINTLFNILNNPTEREKHIIEKTKYLCGITPIYQLINQINSGISLDNNSNVVFHTKVENYKYNINDITNYEILLDNIVIYSKNSNTASKITTFQNSCYQISLRITTNDNKTIIIPILEPNAFNTKYQRQDTIFQTNLNFAKEITDKITSLLPNNYR